MTSAKFEKEMEKLKKERRAEKEAKCAVEPSEEQKEVAVSSDGEN